MKTTKDFERVLVPFRKEAEEIKEKLLEISKQSIMNVDSFLKRDTVKFQIKTQQAGAKSKFASALKCK